MRDDGLSTALRFQNTRDPALRLQTFGHRKNLEVANQFLIGITINLAATSGPKRVAAAIRVPSPFAQEAGILLEVGSESRLPRDFVDLIG